MVGHNFMETANHCRETYGTFAYFHSGDEFFHCPECGEPILHQDWLDRDYTVCPICGFNFYTGEMEEEEDE